MNKPIRLLTAATWHHSYGDVALHYETLRQMGMRGIPIYGVSGAGQDGTHIVGGGRILGDGMKPPMTSLDVAIRRFRLPGRHILNTVGVCGPADYSYLNEYEYISVRDKRSAALLASGGVKKIINVAPCPSVLTEVPYDMDLREGLPSHHFLHKDRPYVVIDSACPPGVEDAFQEDAVVKVNTRIWNSPWTKDSQETRAMGLPPHLGMMELLSGATAVVCNSLHLSLLALAADAPFGCLALSTKCKEFWESYPGGTEVMVRDATHAGPGNGRREVLKELRGLMQSLAETHCDNMALAARTIDKETTR